MGTLVTVGGNVNWDILFGKPLGIVYYIWTTHAPLPSAWTPRYVLKIVKCIYSSKFLHENVQTVIAPAGYNPNAHQQ